MSTAFPSTHGYDDQQSATVAYPVANQAYRSYHGHRYSPYGNDGGAIPSQQHRYHATAGHTTALYSSTPHGHRAHYVSGAELSPRPPELTGKETTAAPAARNSPTHIVNIGEVHTSTEQQHTVRHSHHHVQVQQHSGYSSVFLTPPPSAQESAVNVHSPDRPQGHSSARLSNRDQVHPSLSTQAGSSEAGDARQTGRGCHYSSTGGQPRKAESNNSDEEESADETSPPCFNNLWQPPVHSSVISRGQPQVAASPRGSSSDDSQEGSSVAGEQFSLPNGRVLRLSDEFAKVPGRLSLLGSASKYTVTVGEIRRRLAPPECLNASLLGGVLRKAKAKNGGSDLRKTLDEIGLNLPPGRRKAASTSMLTSLVEEEARALANQFTGVCYKMFPIAELANCVAEKHSAKQGSSSVGDNERLQEIRSASEVTKELCSLLESYIAEEGADPDNDQVQLTGLRQFSLITHSFGVLVVHGVLTLYQQYLASLEKRTNGHIVNDNHVLHSSAPHTTEHLHRPSRNP